MQRNFSGIIRATLILCALACQLIYSKPAYAADVQAGDEVVLGEAAVYFNVDGFCEQFGATITTNPIHGQARIVRLPGSDSGNGCPGDRWTLYYTADTTLSDGTKIPDGTTDYIEVDWRSESDFFITIRGEVDTSKNNGAPSCPDAVGQSNPINGATGNKFQTETDFIGGAATGLSLSRSYNSQDNSAGSTFGSKWRGNWQSQLTVLDSGAKIQAQRPNGRVETFTKDATTNSYVSDADVRTRLRVVSTGWRLDGCADDQSEYYATAGNLTKIIARSGQTTRLTYDTNGRLIRVVGPFGHQLSFLNDANGRVSRVTVPDGGAYQYAYDGNNNLVSVTYPDGRTRQYGYENASFPNALTGIIDENGARFATFAYQADGKAVSSEHAGGVERTTFAYNADGTTTITSPLGAAQTYAFAHLFGVKRPLTVSGTPDPSTGGKSFTYDARGFLYRRVDWSGTVTKYTHDARGNETSRIEAAGTGVERATTTTWHAKYDLPVQRTQPGARHELRI